MPKSSKRIIGIIASVIAGAALIFASITSEAHELDRRPSRSAVQTPAPASQDACSHAGVFHPQISRLVSVATSPKVLSSPGPAGAAQDPAFPA